LSERKALNKKILDFLPWEYPQQQGKIAPLHILNSTNCTRSTLSLFPTLFTSSPHMSLPTIASISAVEGERAAGRKRRRAPAKTTNSARDENEKHPRKYSHGYLLEDDFVAASDEEDDNAAEEAEKALAIGRALLLDARRQRRARAAAYEHLAKRQRKERVARGLPADEEDVASESVESSDDNESDGAESE
jgi:hypothetical protein